MKFKIKSTIVILVLFILLSFSVLAEDINPYVVYGTGDLEKVKQAIENGDDINYRGEAGFTPIIWAAAFNSHPEVVLYLLDRGADPTIKNAKGKNALDCIEMNDKLINTEAHDRLVKIFASGQRGISVNAENKIRVIILPLVDNTQVDVGFVSYIYRKTTPTMYTEVINTTFEEIMTKRFPNEKYKIVDYKSIDSILQNEGYNLNLLDLPDRTALKNIATQAKVRGIIGIEFFQFGTLFIPYKPKERPWALSCRLRVYDGETDRFVDVCFTKNEIYNGSVFGLGEDDKNISKIVKDLVTKTMDQALMNISF